MTATGGSVASDVFVLRHCDLIDLW